VVTVRHTDPKRNLVWRTELKVRDITELLESDKWRIVRTRGSHRQFKHPWKQGAVTVSGHLRDDIAPGTLNSILKQAGLKMKYLIVVEKTDTGFSAYSPDVSGCIATGATSEDVERLMTEALEFHFEGMREEGLEPPPADSYGLYVELSS
jgi:predicted RNA binding protein YcfA (HicA-like mRNA interferase family)/predicted RNase H-like HicB family nuclease